MDQLNSDLLRTFLAVADAGSVTEGAARIHRSQSAASLQIRKLEDVLGQPIFERHGRGVVLSAAVSACCRWRVMSPEGWMRRCAT